MTSEADHTLPGVTGLYFDCSQLTDSGWQQEHTARQSLEHWCSQCGQSACDGFGVTLKDDGVWSCADPSRRASAEATVNLRVRGAHEVSAEASLAKPSDETGTLDLFGEAA